MRASSMAPDSRSAQSSSQNPIVKMILRFGAIAFAFVLLGALWSTALARISDRATATDLLTRAGTDLINPLLLANGSGLAQSTFQQIEQSAQSHPTQPVQLPFIKVQIPGQQIAGKSFTDASRVIYAHVADAYYTGGPGAAFALPPQLQSLVSTYTPFVTSSSSAVTGTVKSNLPSLPLPQLPSFATQIYTTVGITPTTLTAAGHQDAVNRSGLLWALSAVLAVILIVLSAGWARLTSVAWPLFHASWHIALIGAIATVLVDHNPVQAAPYLGVLNIIGGTFMTVFYAAALIGMAAIVAGFVGKRLTAATAGARSGESSTYATADRYQQNPFTPGYQSAPTEPQYSPQGQAYPSPGSQYPQPGQGYSSPGQPYSSPGTPYSQNQGPTQPYDDGSDQYPPRPSR